MLVTGGAKKKIILAVLIVAAVVAAGVLFLYEERPKDQRVKASGTVEVTEVQLAPQASGRLVELNITEAQQVKKGDLIARLSMDGADHQLAAAEAQARAAQQRYQELSAGYRKEDVSKAQAEAAMRKTQYEQAERDRIRFKELADNGAVAVRDAELYAQNADAARNALKMANDQLALLQAGYRPEQIAAAKANMEAAEAQLERARVQIEYKEFYSPADGTILTKNYELGDVISAGAPLATLGVMDDCWVKLYIPSTQLGLVKLGGKAEVRVDAYPDRVFEATVTEVNQQAEYNPRLSLTQSERANMVFWIKISITNPDGVIKPGIPADAVLL